MQYYYIEFRQPIGLDAHFANFPDAINGVLIHLAPYPQQLPGGSFIDGHSSVLLDMTPDTATIADAALGVSRSFRDDAAGIEIRVESVSSSEAVISVMMPGSTDIMPPSPPGKLRLQ